MWKAETSSIPSGSRVLDVAADPCQREFGEHISRNRACLAGKTASLTPPAIPHSPSFPQPHAMPILGTATPIRGASPAGGGPPVAVILDPDDIPNVEISVRLDDYLNDKIQTRGDFENLPELLVKVEHSTKLLQEQVRNMSVMFWETMLTLHSFKMPDPSLMLPSKLPQIIPP